MPAILGDFRSLKDRTLKLTFETNEPTPEQLVAIANSSQKAGYLAFKEDPFKEKERELIQDLKSDFDDKGKSKAQRLRAVLYRCWEQNPEGYEVPDDHYNHYLEKIITHYKNKLDA
jgi:hypothetical protein